jgi:L-rhamnose-H+ transport protein
LGAGICVHRLGFAVQGALIGGIGTAVGTLAPLILQHAKMLVQLSGLLIQMGTLITLAGVALCGWAGYYREQSSKQQGRGAGFLPRETAMTQAPPTRKSYFLTLMVAVLSGRFAAFMNLALAYGREIAERAQEAGAASHWAPFAIWPIAFLGGSLVNLAYCVFLLARNNTWRDFRGGLGEVLNPALSACMWTGGVLLYSSATTYLGVLGVSIGFAMFFIVLMLSGQLLGVLTGEWKFVAAQIYRPFAIGCSLLALAIFVFGASNFFSM